MANSYYEATGVLVLDRVTPVIQALFGAFALAKALAGQTWRYPLIGPAIERDPA